MVLRLDHNHNQLVLDYMEHIQENLPNFHKKLMVILILVIQIIQIIIKLCTSASDLLMEPEPISPAGPEPEPEPGLD